jgi:hypothetical protein
MKEFTKSVASIGLAGALFSARQISNVVIQPPRSSDSDKATDSFNSVAQAVADRCGDSLRETYHAVDRIQRESIEAAFRFLSLEAFTSHGAGESFSGIASQVSSQFRAWMSDRGDCGCDDIETSGETSRRRQPGQSERGFPGGARSTSGATGPFPDAVD